MCKLDDEKEEQRRKRGATLSCTGMNMTQRQQPDPPLLSSLLFSPIPQYPPRERREGTVSMATAEQRRVAFRKCVDAQWCVLLFLFHTHSSSSGLDVQMYSVHPLMKNL